MKTTVEASLERSDPIAMECAIEAAGLARKCPVLRLGDARIAASVGQLAAIRDLLDCWLCGEPPEFDDQDRARLERAADDQDCRWEESW